MARNTQYKYKIKFMYQYNGQEKEFDYKSIISVIVNKDYQNMHRPLMFLKLSLDKSFIDYMIDHKDENYIYVTIDKYVYGNTIEISESYINEKMIYFIDSNKDDMNNINYDKATKESDDIQRQITIGLMKLDTINSNKKSVSGIYDEENLSLTEIILANFSDDKLLFEPIPYQENLKRVMIPYQDTKVKLLEYLEQTYGLYNTNFRLFFDYDKTYLISSSGNGVKSKDEQYNKVIFHINKLGTEFSKVQGMTVSDDDSCYDIHVDASDVTKLPLQENTKLFNVILGIDPDGNTKEIQLSNSSSIDTNKKVKIVHLNNLNNLEYMKAQLENNNMVLTIMKSEIDSSIFTINKEYYIQGSDEEEMNGKYILTVKKELYTREENHFIGSCIFTFKKVS